MITITEIRSAITAANQDRGQAEGALRETEEQLRAALTDLNSAQLEVGRRADLAAAGEAMARLDGIERRVRALRLMKEARKAVISDADSRLGDLDNQLSSALSTADRLRQAAAQAAAKAQGTRREAADLARRVEVLETSAAETEGQARAYRRQLAALTGETAGEPDTTEAAEEAAAA